MTRHLDSGALEELTLTTNGSQLARFADDLFAAGVRRVNVSLDTLDDAKFAQITRWGRLKQVLEGIDAAQAAAPDFDFAASLTLALQSHAFSMTKKDTT
jgi:cyclic pyranopterin phosphate synthase